MQITYGLHASFAGFTGDLFTVGAGNENKGARMWLVNENQRYETDIHKDGCTRAQVTAYTRPLPAGTYKVVIAIDGQTMADNDICTRSKCKFTVSLKCAILGGGGGGAGGGDFDRVVNNKNMLHHFDELLLMVHLVGESNLSIQYYCY